MERRNVKTRAELIEFINDVICDHAAESERWVKRDIGSYLEAMSAWLEDCDGYYQNSGDKRDVENPDWQIFADALAAAIVYE